MDEVGISYRFIEIHDVQCNCHWQKVTDCLIQQCFIHGATIDSTLGVLHLGVLDNSDDRIITIGTSDQNGSIIFDFAHQSELTQNKVVKTVLHRLQNNQMCSYWSRDSGMDLYIRIIPHVATCTVLATPIVVRFLSITLHRECGEQGKANNVPNKKITNMQVSQIHKRYKTVPISEPSVLSVPCDGTWVDITDADFLKKPIYQIELDPDIGIAKLGMEMKSADGKETTIVEIGASSLCEGVIDWNLPYQILAAEDEQTKKAFETLLVAHEEVHENDSDATYCLCAYRCSQRFFIKIKPRYPGIIKSTGVIFSARTNILVPTRDFTCGPTAVYQ